MWSDDFFVASILGMIESCDCLLSTFNAQVAQVAQVALCSALCIIYIIHIHTCVCGAGGTVWSDDFFVASTFGMIVRLVVCSDAVLASDFRRATECELVSSRGGYMTDKTKTETETDFFAAALEKGTPGRKASGNAKESAPRVAEVSPAEMVGLLKLKEFESKAESCTKVQITQTRFPSKISCDLAVAGSAGMDVMRAVAIKLGPGKPGVGYSKAQVAALLAKYSRIFGDGSGLCLQTQGWSPALAFPKGQCSKALVEGSELFLGRLDKGIEAGEPAVMSWVETRIAEGVARRAKWQANQDAIAADKAVKKAAEKAAAKAAK